MIKEDKSGNIIEIRNIYKKGGSRMFKVTEDMTIMEVLQMDREVAPIFMSFGLHCLGCPGATMESIGDAGRVHGINVQDLIAELNKYFESK